MDGPPRLGEGNTDGREGRVEESLSDPTVRETRKSSRTHGRKTDCCQTTDHQNPKKGDVTDLMTGVETEDS